MTTIAVVQVKGGAGRSTVSTNLAASLSRFASCLLVDADMPQGTASSWYALRSEAGKAGQMQLQQAPDHRALVSQVQASAADFVVIDCPPRIAEVTRAALVLADLVLVPVGASAAELWATGDVLALIDEAKQQKTIKALMVWNRQRAGTKIGKELKEAADSQLGLQAMNTGLGLRTAFVEALGAGLSVGELPDRAARAELEALTTEVLATIKKRKTR